MYGDDQIYCYSALIIYNDLHHVEWTLICFIII
jgi:hypothetical protein